MQFKDMGSLLKDLRGTKTWDEEFCRELGPMLRAQAEETAKLTTSLTKWAPLDRLAPWQEWVRAELASLDSRYSRDHLREERDYVDFLSRLDKEIRRVAGTRQLCEVEYERLRATRVSRTVM
jgi:hypothetical protein